MLTMCEGTRQQKRRKLKYFEVVYSTTTSGTSRLAAISKDGYCNHFQGWALLTLPVTSLWRREIRQ